MKLEKIPEPSENKVRERVDSEEVERMFGDGRITNSWEIQTAVTSYLWDNWKNVLKQHDIGWTDFQSETRFANNTIESWANNRSNWEDVLSGHAKLLNAEIQ